VLSIVQTIVSNRVEVAFPNHDVLR
jgi:hypothetical protein